MTLPSVSNSGRSFSKINSIHTPPLVHSEADRRAGLPAVAPKAIHMGGLVDRNRVLRHSGSEAQSQVKRRPFELFDFHEAIIQGGHLATQQGHRLDLPFFL